MQNNKKSCQVLGCKHPLPTDRVYHTRYRICPHHAALPEMVQDDIVVRFCQQCGRFQPIEDFEGNKKSCRSKLKMHNAQRKRARERAQAKVKRRRIPSSGKFSPPSSSPPSFTKTDKQGVKKVDKRITPETEVAAIGIKTPVNREAVPALNEVLLATAAAKANANSTVSAAAKVAAITSPAAALAAAHDGCEIDQLTLEDIDTLMEEFNSPLASQISLSIVKEQEDEQGLWQQKQRHSSPEAISPELLPPIVTMDPPPVVFVQYRGAANKCPPFVRSSSVYHPQVLPPPVITNANGTRINIGAADLMNGSCNQDTLVPFDKFDTMQFETAHFRAGNDCLDSEIVAASARLFSCHPSFLPLPILEHLKSLLKTAKF